MSTPQERWNARNPETVRRAKAEYMARFRAEHPDIARARVRAAQPSYYRRNKAKYVAHGAAYDAARDKRTPPWADLKEIERVYAEAKELSEFTGMPWHVDHVVPLRGRKVSGLHVCNNLQLLPGIDNIRKNNLFEVA
jgi:hypothetical protein